MKSPSSFRGLWRHVTLRRRKQLALLLIIMVLASFAEVASIGAILPFLGVLMSPERVFLNPVVQPIALTFGITEPQQLLFPLTMVFILTALFSGAVRLLLLWIQTRLGFAIGADFSAEIYKRTLYQPYAVHVTRNTSQVISGITTKANEVISFYLLPMLFIASSGLIMLAIIIALITINPIVALAIFGGFGVLYSWISFATRKHLARDSRLISHESNQVIKALQEGLGGIRDVLIDGTQGTYCKIYCDAVQPLRRSQANVQIISGAPRFIVESFGMALIAILAYNLAQSEEGLAVAIPVLGALAIGAQRLLPVVQLIHYSVSNIRGHKSSVKNVLDLLDQPLPKYFNSSLPAHMAFNESIRLNRVSFRYGESSPWVLQDIDFEIPKGGRIGFMGATGSGKSTLLDLVMGLLEPSNGTLTIDKIPVTNLNHRAWQAHIAHVPQTIYLSDASIAENIAFGVRAEEIDMDRVRQAARQAQIASYVEALPEQYTTIVGERGVRLSGGQRQRIGIARALYKQSDIIIFDEATSALDGLTEQAVMEAIESLSSDLTILIIAHRLSTLLNCSQIVELKDGRINRVVSYNEIVGDHQELVRGSASYG